MFSILITLRICNRPRLMAANKHTATGNPAQASDALTAKLWNRHKSVR